MNRISALLLIAASIIAVVALGFSVAAFMAISTAASISGSTTLTTMPPAWQNDGAKPQNYTTLMVLGYGEVSYVPDRAIVVFAALGYGKTAADALSGCSSKMSRIFSALEALGISRDKMKTTGITVTPRYNWDQTPPQIVDYEASYSLRVEISDISLVGKAIDAAFAAGADKMNGLQFILSKEKESELAAQAIREAIADALRKAEVTASQLGLKIVKIDSISISHQQAPPPIIVRAVEAAEIPIAPGEGEISAAVSLTILLST